MRCQHVCRWGYMRWTTTHSADANLKVIKMSFGFKGTVLALLATAVLPASARADAQSPIANGLLTFDCSQLPPFPADFATYIKAAREARAANRPMPVMSKELLATVGQWQAQNKENDPLQICKYDAANKALPAPTKARVVFMGDSITEFWDGDFFKGDQINRGITGQTTTQMLGRFYADVIALHPAVVHILAGTNDVAGNTGPMNLSMVENNFKAMIDLAQAHGIRVVLGTVPPAKHFPWRANLDPVPSIAALNGWIRSYAREKGITVVDYFAALNDGAAGLAKADSDDGVHPTRAGYAKMEALAKGELVPARR